MSKTIKTKEYIADIKTKDKLKDINHYMKQQVIMKKTSVPKEQNYESKTDSAPEAQATDCVTDTVTLTNIQSAGYIKKRMKSRRNIPNKIPSSNPHKPTSMTISVSHDHLYAPAYQSLMKSSYFHKFKTSQLQHLMLSHLLKQSTKLVTISSKMFQAIKSVFTTTSYLITCGFGLILTLTITLFIGVFSSFSNSPVYASTLLPLSSEVIELTPIIEKYAEEFGISEYVPLIQAIMMHESAGQGPDAMNASSFLYNTEFPSGITNSEYSIHVGIQYLSNCLQASGVQSAADSNNLYLAIQGYDFGIDYIYWAKTNFNGYSKFNAQVYYEEFNPPHADINYVENVLQYINLSFGTLRLEPNFDNIMAWGNNNPYSKKGLYGQCTWFAWGRFYEIYGFDPGFRGDGWNCAQQLVAAHPDKFELSSEPQVGAIFSCIGRNHVGIVIGWDGTNITIQEGNLDGMTNSFTQAKSDWQTVTYNLDRFRIICDGVVFAKRSTIIH